MKTARDIMTTEVITLAPSTTVSDAAKVLLDNGINGAPVVDARGRMMGLLCQSDLVALQKKMPVPSFFTFLDGMLPLKSSRKLEEEVKKILAATVEEAMTRKPVSVSPETPVDEVATLMVERKFHTVPVLSDGALVGVIGKEDVLKTLS